MTASEIQLNIIEKVLNTNDVQLLKYLNDILSGNEGTEVYKLFEFEKQILHDSISELKISNTISSNNVFSSNKKRLYE